MPDQEVGNANAGFRGELNEPQQRRLMVTCRYIDSLFCEIEHTLHPETSHSPFPRYVVDVTPSQAAEIEDGIRHMRVELSRFLAWQHLEPEPAEIPVSRSVLTDLSFVDNAIEELKPSYLRGCGPVPADAVDELNKSIRGLQALVRDMAAYVRSEANERKP